MVSLSSSRWTFLPRELPSVPTRALSPDPDRGCTLAVRARPCGGGDQRRDSRKVLGGRGRMGRAVSRGIDLSTRLSPNPDALDAGVAGRVGRSLSDDTDQLRICACLL